MTEQINGCPVNPRGQEGSTTNRHEAACEGDRYAHSLYCSDGFVSVYIVQKLPGGTLAIRAIYRMLLLSQKGRVCA